MFYYFIFLGLYIYYFLFNNLILFLNGPLKYRIINKLQNYIYFNPIGLKKVLQLDTNNKKTISNRQKGIEYLKNELIGNKNIHTNLTDCRFKKIKVIGTKVYQNGGRDWPIWLEIKSADENSVLIRYNGNKKTEVLI